MSLYPEIIPKPNCISIKKESSTVEVVESSNCIINIDYFVKDEKISLELYKTSTDAKCVKQKLSSSKNLQKVQGHTAINYNKASKPKKMNPEKMKYDDLLFLKIPEKLRSDSRGLKNEQPVRDTSQSMGKTSNSNCLKMSSCCSIHFDGTMSRSSKQHQKRSRIHLENTSQDISLQPFSKTNANYIGNSSVLECRKSRNHRTHRTVNEFLNKEANDAVLLEHKKHAKFEIVLTPKSKTTTLISDRKSENSSSKRKKVILQSNTLEMSHRNHEVHNDFKSPLELSLDSNKNEAQHEDNGKFYKRRHKRRIHPVVLTMSTNINANIKGINNIFSEHQNSEKKLLMPHRPVHTSDDEEEEHPFYIPVPQDFNKNSAKTPRDRVIETHQTVTEVERISQMPRRFIGNDLKEGKRNKHSNINLDESNNTMNESRASSIQTDTPVLTYKDLIEKFENENPTNRDMLQFCNFMFHLMKQGTSNNNQASSLNMNYNNFKKLATEFVKGIQNCASDSEKSPATKIPRKIPASEKQKQLSSRTEVKEQILPILKRRNTTMMEKMFSNSSQKPTNVPRSAQPRNKVHFKKCSPKRAKSAITKPSTNSKSPVPQENNNFQAYKAFQKVVEKFTPVKNQEKPNLVSGPSDNQDGKLEVKDSLDSECNQQITETDDLSQSILETVRSKKISDTRMNHRLSDQRMHRTINEPKITTKIGDQIRISSNQKEVRKCRDQKQFRKINDQEVNGETSDEKLVTLSATLTEQSSEKNIAEESATQNKNTCCQTEMKRARTFCTKIDCMQNTSKSIKDFSELPLTKNCAAALKLSVSNIVQDCCREKAKYFHVNKSHTPGCIHNSSFLFTKCNTEHTKQSSFQKRKEYNKKWREKYQEKEWKRGLQQTSDTLLNIEKMSQTEISQDKIPDTAIHNQHLQNSTEATAKSCSRSTLSRNKFSNPKLDTCTSSNRFSRTTSIFSFPHQERPRKNYAEINLPSFICPDSAWIQNENISNENSKDETVYESTNSVESVRHSTDIKQLQSPKRTILTRENSNSVHSNKTNSSNKSLPKTKTIKRKHSVAMRIRNRFIFGASKQTRRNIKPNKKSDSKTKVSCCNSVGKPKIHAVQEWYDTTNYTGNENRATLESDENEEFPSSTTPIKGKRQHIKNLISEKVYSDKTVAFVRDFLPDASQVSSSETALQVVHQNMKFLELNEDKSEQVKEPKYDVDRGISDDTLFNCKECTSSQIFGEKELENNVNLQYMKEDTVDVLSDLIQTKDEHFIKNELNNPDLPKEIKNKSPKKSSKLFSMQKVSSHIGKLFRGKKS